MNFYKTESLTGIKNKVIKKKKNKLMITKGENMGGMDKSRAWDEHTQTIIYKIDNEQGHPMEHRELYSIFCDHYKKKESKKE